jgi:outer membrane protein OmpA-like peptidoglycan-associated protein
MVLLTREDGMKLKLSALTSALCLLVVDVAYAPRPADACGVKLAIRYSRPRRVAAKSATPSHVLLVGSPPKRLEHDLSSAGHEVEVESSFGNAKRAQYDIIVVASNDQANDVRAKFPDAAVVVRSGDITADVRSVEGQAGRHPITVASGREVIAAGPPHTEPIKTGSPGDDVKVAAKASDDKVVAAKEPDRAVAAKAPEPTPPTPPPAPDKISTTPPPAIEQPVTPPPAHVPATSATLDEELYFSLNSAKVGETKALRESVKWLKANADIHATLEGYADPSGTPEGNMALSQQRAEAVRDYLVAHGINSDRLDTSPFGDTKLKYGRNDGRNRRVAIEAKR